MRGICLLGINKKKSLLKWHKQLFMLLNLRVTIMYPNCCAVLDAYYARLYGLTRDELRYILDPKEVHGDDFPGETSVC